MEHYAPMEACRQALVLLERNLFMGRFWERIELISEDFEILEED